MARYLFEIGATQVAMINLENLATPVIPPDWSYSEFSREVELASGKVRGVGFPRASWTWGYLEKAERTMLRTFCTGKSAEVYIKTLVNSLAYKTFRVVMIWPAGEEPTVELYPDFVLEFRHLVEVV